MYRMLQADLRVDSIAIDVSSREHLALVPRFDEVARLTLLETLRYAQVCGKIIPFDLGHNLLYDQISSLIMSTTHCIGL